MKRLILFLLVIAICSTLPAQERVDLDTIARIRTEGFSNSKVMETARALTDRFGARLTGSSNLHRAAEWSRDQMAEWGLVRAQLEPWGPFGRGWESERWSVRMIRPDSVQLVAVPKAWTAGTEGAIRGPVIQVELAGQEDLDEQKGKLTGKILLLGKAPQLQPWSDAALHRYDEKELSELTQYRIPSERNAARRAEFRKRREFRKTLNVFLSEEGVLATIEPGSGGDGGTFDVGSGGSQKPDEPIGIPSLVMAAEHYNRIARLLDDEVDVELELDVRNRFLDAETQFNVIAEIPGTDRSGEVVMIGAHLDSWHSGTGATDNAAGVAAMMEAARILSSLDVKPRRTIRVALWTGEEQGLLGSRHYVEQHFATWPEPEDPSEADTSPWSRRNPGEPALKPEHAKLSAYFNLDNGTGRIRGIWAQQNLSAVPIFKAWLEPLHDLGATTVSTRDTGSTDHIPFDAAGLPGFQFIQDNVEYSSRTHHSNYDVYDRLQREDLMQASVVIATFAWNAATRAGKLPRKPKTPIRP